VGLTLGGGLGVWLALAEPLVLLLGGAALLVGAVALAWSGEPVAELLAPLDVRRTKPVVTVEPVVIRISAGHSVDTGHVAVVKVEPPTPPPSSPLRLPEMVTIPTGVFRMGSPENELVRYGNEGPIHEVYVSAFQCMRYPVTRRLYKAVMENDPGWPEGDADERPVNHVSWLEAVRFCNRLSELAGLTLCYRSDAENNITWIQAADGYRLLTEAEWEYACRAGSQGRWCFGDDEQPLEQYAWYAANSKGQPQPIGQKLANAWGLYHMHGNVLEWCWNWYDLYTDAPQRDPVGPPQGDGRVLRGGAFDYPARFLRSAYRGWDLSENWNRNRGFRCARSPRRQHS
jgi:formylglycine-generating enzyme required for sulfatase activity